MAVLQALKRKTEGTVMNNFKTSSDTIVIYKI